MLLFHGTEQACGEFPISVTTNPRAPNIDFIPDRNQVVSCFSQCFKLEDIT
jgi:hypothetical protein